MSPTIPLAFALIALTSSCVHYKQHGVEVLQGIWKSDAEKTLASMRLVDNMTEESSEIFENDFFGHLYVEYRQKTVRYWLDDEDYDLGFQDYEVIEETDEYVIIREWDPVLQELADDKLTLDGDCYWVTTSVYEFKEYFCRVAGDM